MDCTAEQASEGMAIVRVLAAVLERLVSANSTSANQSSHEVTKFHALKAPGISVLQYLERIHKYASCSTECFILALIYIDRLIQRNNFILSELNVHRVVITAVLLAAKFFDDAYYNNAYYAKVGGVQISEMNSLEVEFLFRINFSLHVTPEVFHKYNAELLSHAVGVDFPIPNLVQSRPQQENISFAPKAPYYPLNDSKPSLVVNANSNQSSVGPSAGHYPSRRITPSPPDVYHGYPADSLQKPTSTNLTQMSDRDYKVELGRTATEPVPTSSSKLNRSNNQSTKTTSHQQALFVSHDRKNNNFSSQNTHFTTLDQQVYSSGQQGLKQNVPQQPFYSSKENTSNSINMSNNSMLTAGQPIDSHFSRNKQQISVISHNHYALQYANNSSTNQTQQQNAPHLVGCGRLTGSEVSSYFHHHNDLTNKNNFLSTSPHLAQAIRP